MHDILQALAAANNWVFDYGRQDFHNLHEAEEQKNVSHLFLDPVDFKKNRGDNGSVESITYTGSFMILFSSDIDKKTYEDRYQDYIKPIVSTQVDIIEEDLICNHEANLEEWMVKEVINIFDYNFDGVLVPYKVTIDE